VSICFGAVGGGRVQGARVDDAAKFPDHGQPLMFRDSSTSFGGVRVLESITTDTRRFHIFERNFPESRLSSRFTNVTINLSSEAYCGGFVIERFRTAGAESSKLPRGTVVPPNDLQRASACVKYQVDINSGGLFEFCRETSAGFEPPSRP
jgi:hypothetical protein